MKNLSKVIKEEKETILEGLEMLMAKSDDLKVIVKKIHKDKEIKVDEPDLKL